MGKVRRRLQWPFAGIGFAATMLIFAQAGVAEIPEMTAGGSAASFKSETSGEADRTVPSKYSAQPFRKLNFKTPATAPRLAPVLTATSYAPLAMGPIRFRDGAITLPGSVKPVRKKAKEPESAEVGQSVAVATGILFPEPYNVLPADRADSEAGERKAFAGLPLVGSAHAADAMGGPLNRVPLEGHILFEAEDTALNVEARTRLDKLVKTLRESHGHVDVVAYAGKPGSNSSDARRLSLRRALAVRAYLVSRGIDQRRIAVRPMGGARDDGPEARADVFYTSY